MSNNNTLERLWKLQTKVNMLVLDGKRDPEAVADIYQKILDQTGTWHEQDGVVYLSVTSDGTTGPQWIEVLENKGFRLGSNAKNVLRSPDFQPTKGVTYKIAILKGQLFENDDRITKRIRAEASRRKFTKLNAEAACLIRANFSDDDIKAMGLVWVTVMHEPIESDGNPYLLSADRGGGGRWLSAYCGDPGGRWGRESGFAFAVSQVQN